MNIHSPKGTWEALGPVILEICGSKGCSTSWRRVNTNAVVCLTQKISNMIKNVNNLSNTCFIWNSLEFVWNFQQVGFSFYKGRIKRDMLTKFISELLNTRLRLRIVCSQDIVMEIAVARCFSFWKVIFWFYFFAEEKPFEKVVGGATAVRGPQNLSSKNYSCSCVRNMNRRGGGKWVLRDRANWVLYLHSVVDLSFAWKISCIT